MERPVAKLDLSRSLAKGLAAFAVLAGMCAPLLEDASRNAVWAHAGALACYVALERLAYLRWPGRSISLLRVTLFLAATQPFFLIISFFIQGDAQYATEAGWISHADGAWQVALAGAMLHVAALAGAALTGPPGPAPARSGVAIWTSYSGKFYLLVSWMALAYSAARLVLLFFPREVPLEISYGFRIFLGLFLAVFIVLGMALRHQVRSALLPALVTMGVSAVVLLAGSRSEAMFPLFFMAIGYVLAKPVRTSQLLRWAAVAIPVFMTSMFVGSLVRQDERGRTGEAVLVRAYDLSSMADLGKEEKFISDSIVRRMVSDSTHSVLTRIPRERPFEDEGLVKLPLEFVDRVLPRLNLTGISEAELPRNWMLNDLGFRVNWMTSVELGLVADAWYRGGYLGLVIVGLLLGLSLQLTENAVYRAMRRRPQVSVLLFFGMTGLLFVEARDIVAALRGLLFMAAAGSFLVGAAMLLEARRAAPGRQRPQAVRKPAPAAST